MTATAPAGHPARPRVIQQLRVSSRGQLDNENLNVQRTALARLLKEVDGAIVTTIDEGAVSGAADLINRPSLKRLDELAGQYDELHVFKLDRITRHKNPMVRFAVYSAVAAAGAIIRDCFGNVIDPKDEVGELSYYFQTFMASKENKKIAERTTAGKIEKAKLDRPNRAPYGRVWSKGDLRHGVPGEWLLDPEKAAIYKSLFDRVLAGEGQRSIAKDLNERGIASPGGVRWSSACTSRLLKDRGAYGYVTRNGVELKGCPPIVDRATFDRVNDLLTVRGKRGSGPKPKLEVLLRGLLECGSCGGGVMVAMSTDSAGHGRKRVLRYVCTKRPLPGCRHWHRVKVVDEAARSMILRLLEGPEARRALEHRGKPVDVAVAIKEAKEELRQLDQREEELARLLLKGLSPKVNEKLLGEVARDRRAVEARLANAKLHAQREVERAATTKDIDAELERLRRIVTRMRTWDFEPWRELAQIVSRELLQRPFRLTAAGAVE
jgi:site-specific DNA recombinase